MQSWPLVAELTQKLKVHPSILPMLAPEKSPSVVDFLSRMDCCVAVVASVELPEAVMLALAVERLNPLVRV